MEFHLALRRHQTDRSASSPVGVSAGVVGVSPGVGVSAGVVGVSAGVVDVSECFEGLSFR